MLSDLQLTKICLTNPKHIYIPVLTSHITYYMKKKKIYISHKYTYFPPQLWYVNFMKQIVKNCLGFVNNFPKFKQNLATPEKQTADAFYVCVI